MYSEAPEVTFPMRGLKATPLCDFLETRVFFEGPRKQARMYQA